MSLSEKFGLKWNGKALKHNKFPTAAKNQEATINKTRQIFATV